MYSVLDWLLSFLALGAMLALALGAQSAVKLLEGCIALTRKIAPGSNGGWGVVLCLGLLIGVPILAVVWGYATGRLPAASPYQD